MTRHPGASGITRWNLDTLAGAIRRLQEEQSNLETQRNHMQTQQQRVGVNWQSPAGRQYQQRLGNDIATVNNVIEQLRRRIASLQRVQAHYSTCENEVRTALNRLPR